MNKDLRRDLTEYGAWRVRNEARLSGYGSTNVLYRIQHEGVVIRMPPSQARYVGVPRHYQKIHRAWESAPLKLRTALEARYMEHGPDGAVAAALGVSIQELRRRVALAHIWVEGYLAALDGY